MTVSRCAGAGRILDRFDLIERDTPVVPGLDHVPEIDGPASITLAVGDTQRACFVAPLPFDNRTRTYLRIADDGWTYDSPANVSLAPVAVTVPECLRITGLASGTGTLTAHLRDASLAVALTVR